MEKFRMIIPHFFPPVKRLLLTWVFWGFKRAIMKSKI